MNTEPTAPTVDSATSTPTAASSASELVGRVVADRYRVVEVLGEGGMGAVYVAEHLKLRKQVALKTIRAEFAGDGQAERRFEREAQATAKIDHPHVVSAMDYGHLPDGGAYLVVQLVRGRSLGKQLERGALHWRQVGELGAQIADTLATCHAAGVIHRDLKPDNILLEQRDDGSFHARVVDFGIARLSDEPGDGSDGTLPLTRMGSIIGTPGYMAPEQAVGQSIDHRVDLYALGVILWEACAGRRLWSGDTLTEMFARQLAGTAPSLKDELPGHIPEALSDLITALVSPIAAHRPASAAAIRDDLRRLAFSGDAVVTGFDLRASGSSFSVPPLTAPPSTAPNITATGTQISNTRPDLPLPVRLRVAVVRLRGLAAELPRRVLYGGAAVGVLTLALAVRCACGGAEAPPSPVPEPAPEQPVKVARAKSRDDAPKPAPAPTKPPPVDPKPVEPAPAPAAPAATDDVPAAFAGHANTLLSSTSAKARKRAADAITGASAADRETIPEYVRNIAWLEKQRTCDGKRPILLKIEEAGDTRALPALQQLARTPRNTCGNLFMRRDCMACLRADLGRVIGRFEAQTAAP